MIATPGFRFTNLDKFQSTLKEYMRYSKRSTATALNTKALFICRRALRLTKKADKDEIVFFMLQHKGRGDRTSYHEGSLPGAVINKRNGVGGGFYGEEMYEEIEKMINARIRSIAYLKSGWIDSIRILTPHSDTRGQPSIGQSPKRYGDPKGSAIPASDYSTNPKVEFTNAAVAQHDKKNSLWKYAGPALQEAFNFEIASMRIYILKKLDAEARKLGIRTTLA